MSERATQLSVTEFRLILDDSDFGALAGVVDVRRLGMVVSLWAQRVTGLNVDFQVQQQTAANAEVHGRRHPLGLVTLKPTV